MKVAESLRERLTAQKFLIGLLQAHASATVAEMAGNCGYDFVLLDGEHGVFCEKDFIEALRAISNTDAIGMVRIGDHNANTVGRYLDMGAQVIVAPNVTTAQQASALARAMWYPPTGTRGIGAALHRATRYGLDTDAHMRDPSAGVSFLPIVESLCAVENVERILAVDGVDGVIVGPADLSADIGAPLDFSRTAYLDALTRVERAAAQRGKILATAPHGEQTVDALLERGYQMLIVNSDVSLMREAMCRQVNAIKRKL
jgi:4-hydroxy-2-oxoheptanedioate aldolase